jgi:hypothetical protein
VGINFWTTLSESGVGEGDDEGEGGVGEGDGDWVTSREVSWLHPKRSAIVKMKPRIRIKCSLLQISKLNQLS